MMISQLEFDPSDYHLRVMIEDMEREGRPEHTIAEAVRAASDFGSTGEARAIENHAPVRVCNSIGWAQRLRPSALHRAKARCAA
jgi:hypothetical protein